MAVAKSCVEICSFKCAVKLGFVIFCYVEDKRAYPSIFIGVVLPPCYCSSDCYDYAGCGFSDFNG